MKDSRPSALARVSELVGLCGTPAGVMPATALYNEGWMLRLVLDWFSRQPPSAHPLSFLPGSTWYSEARLSTQFRRRPASPGNQFAESWTHADGVIGNFESFERRGDVRLTPDAKQLVVVEAKMFSSLSAGTKRAPTFYQASRNVACIAETLLDRQPDSLSLGFVVVAPKAMIEEWALETHLTPPTISKAVAARVALYIEDRQDHAEKHAWYESRFVPMLDHLRLKVLSWESIIEHVAAHDHPSSLSLNEFFEQCIRFNGPRAASRTRAPTMPND